MTRLAGVARDALTRAISGPRHRVWTRRAQDRRPATTTSRQVDTHRNICRSLGPGPLTLVAVEPITINPLSSDALSEHEQAELLAQFSRWLQSNRHTDGPPSSNQRNGARS